MDIIDEIKQYGPYSLSGKAEVSQPDTHNSPGALFLISIRDAVVEAFEEYGAVDERKHGEIADAAPSVMTHEKWQQFVDLCAYQEDLSDFGETVKQGIDATADLALFNIAHRLVGALVEEINDNTETEGV
ncbi:OCR-like antirestriction protein [Streptomyces phage Hank144]|uniref:OCR-like antirestriction protein n=1 Tax=Streptomyces phage Hank144 TaxID=2301573 RepID=A0A385DP85_9CAUD|nr:hypothetical protein KGG76_gp71 [Streptomyces phage Hank144]AXQ61124.1 OCR-like antirestriction protein [Streptomyces phage Hank144]